MRNFFGGRNKKHSKNKSEDENDLYVPQPVTVQRSWGTKATLSKSKKKSSVIHQQSQAQLHQPHPPQALQHSQTVKNVIKNRKNSNSSSNGNNEQYSISQQKPSNTEPAKYPNVYQKPTSGGYFQSKSVHEIGHKNDNISQPKNIPKKIVYEEKVNNNQPPTAHEQKFNENENTPAIHPTANSQQTKSKHHKIQYSEGGYHRNIHAHGTGSPEVAGDISNYKHQQQQKPLNIILENDGRFETSPSPKPNDINYPILEQSRTSATGPQLNNNYMHQQPMKSARDDPSAVLSSKIAAQAYAPEAPPLEESSDDGLDMISAMLQGPKSEAQEQKINLNMDEFLGNNESERNLNAENVGQEIENVQQPASVSVSVSAEEKIQPVINEKQAVIEEEDDDCGLADWLMSIGFKKKKLKIMINALSEMGFDDFEELKQFLIQLYHESYGQQQKSWMDQMQKDLNERGIKFAQWITFSQAAKNLIEREQQNKAKNADENGNSSLNNSSVDKLLKVMQPQLHARGLVVIHEAEQLHMNNLLSAMSNIQSNIEQLTALVLNVQKNERLALETMNKEFTVIEEQLNKRKVILDKNISNVASEKYALIDDQISDLRMVDAEYQECMAEFNRILQNNEQYSGSSSSNKNKKMRAQKIAKMVTNVMNKNLKYSNLPSVCTPLIGFNCNISPVLVQMKECGMVSWGNPPLPPIIIRIATSDWAIQIMWKPAYISPEKQGNNSSASMNEDPVNAYEVQCVLASNEQSLIWNFDNPKYLYSTVEISKNIKYKRNRMGIVTKHTAAQKCLFKGFIKENVAYAIRIKAKNRNGWSFWSTVVPAKTKKIRKKRKHRKLENIKICKFKGNNSDGHPSHMLFTNDKLIYQSLTVNEFNVACTIMKEITARTIVNCNDWIVFDFANFIELTAIKIKYDSIHSRWGNVPKLIEIEFADYNMTEDIIDFLYNYKPMTEREKQVSMQDNNERKKEVVEDDDGSEDEVDDILSQMNDGQQPKKKKKIKKSKLAGLLIKNRVMQQLQNKRREDEERYQQLWRMIARIDCKKKSGFQEFGLETIDCQKRRGRFLRVQFVSNFDCIVEQVSKFIVEQIAFIGIQYEIEDYMQ